MSKMSAKWIALIMVICCMMTFCGMNAAAFGAVQQKQNALELVLTKGKPVLSANGVSIACAKPLVSNNIFYIPLRTVLETLGADVIAASGGKITVTFRDVTVEMSVASKNVTINQKKATLSASPILSGKTVMIPLDFLSQCFDISATFSEKTGKAVIRLKDDGSLSDLSFLTGGVGTTKAGNSYFNWTISLPKGTRVSSQTFNSSDIEFENEHYGIIVEVAVMLNQGKTLQQYYDKLMENPQTELGGKPTDSKVVSDAKVPYAEFLYTDSYDEAIYERIYSKGDSFYDIIVTSTDEVDPTLLKKNTVVENMLDSFDLSFSRTDSNIMDLSSVKSGLSHYTSYVTSENTGKKVQAWEMSVLPEWNLKDEDSTSAFDTEFDGNPGEYVKVELQSSADKKDIETVGNDMVNFYGRNFSKDHYTLKSSGAIQVNGVKVYALQFDLAYGSKHYSYDERLLLSNGIIYDITFKSPSDSFKKAEDHFGKMLETFKLAANDIDVIKTELQKTEFNASKNNVGKDDSLTSYENKTFGWKLSLPGNWQKNSTSGQNTETFYDQKSGAMVMVEASPKGNNASQTDKERFASMKLSDKIADKPSKTYTEQIKGRNVTVYLYRLEDPENNNYADMNYYVLEQGNYKYCVMMTVPDLTSSEYNLGVLKNIWASFDIVAK